MSLFRRSDKDALSTRFLFAGINLLFCIICILIFSSILGIFDIIGGLIIGIAQHGLPVSTAAENYIILSVGDGLVAQIPSLLLAIATAIISVTTTIVIIM